MSLGRRRAAEKTLAWQDDNPLTEKQCPTCGEIKPIKEFGQARRTVVSTGQERIYIRSECKKCDCARSKKYREKIGAERYRKQQREASRRRKKKMTAAEKRRHREYQREWAAASRRRKGIKPRMKPQEKGTGKRVPLGPLADFIHEIMKSRKLTTADLAELVEMDQEQVRRILKARENGKRKSWLTLEVVDRILLKLDREEMLTVLYHDT